MGNKGDNISGARARGTSRRSGNPLAKYFYRTYSTSSLVNYLADHGFKDAKSKEAKYAIERIGFYHLFPYLSLSLNCDFHTGPTVKEAHDALTFDRKFQALIFKNIGIFETQLKARYSYLMAEKCGEFSLYSRDNFLRIRNYEKSLSNYQTEVNRKLKTNYEVSKIAKSNDGKLPINVGVECMSLGTLTKLYDNTRNIEVTNEVSSSFGCSKSELSSWGKTICDVRNICAHFDDYLTRKEIPSTPLKIRGIDFNHRNTFYIVLILIRLLDHGTAFNDWHLNYADELRRDVDYVIKEYKDAYKHLLPILGIPEDYSELMAKAENGIIIYKNR